MKMTLEQTRLVGLTLELDCKAREYQALCKQYEVLKSEILDENDKRWVELQQKLFQNKKEIAEIKTQLDFLRY